MFAKVATFASANMWIGFSTTPANRPAGLQSVSMPSLPSHPCANATRGCPNLASSRFCPSCEQSGAAREQMRSSARDRGYDSKWTRYRIGYLRNHPYCADPFEVHGTSPTLATHVDHIKPHRGDWSIFWDKSNHQGLCASCHSRKTAECDGGFGNQKRQTA